MKMIQKLIRSALALSMAVQLLAVPALAAEDAPVYLALGDSISTGYGLSAENQRFSSLVAAKLPGYTIHNEAQDGYTTVDVYNLISTGALDDKIANADLITLTCGGNDMMDTLYEEIAANFNSKQGVINAGKQILPDDVPKYLAGHEGYDLGLRFNALLKLAAESTICGTDNGDPVPFFASKAFSDALNAFETSLYDVTNYVRTLNPDAHFIVNTQYNPYKSFEFIDPDATGASMYTAMYEKICPCLDALNNVISSNAAEIGYAIADVFTAFEPYKGTLCNAKANGMSPELDFHPNAEGHKVIAQTILNTLDTLNSNLEETKFSLVSSNLNKGTVTVTGTGVYSSIAVAFYNSEEKMIGFDMTSLNGSEGQTTQTTLSAKLSGTAVKGKVFLFQRGSLIPHSEAIPF